MQSIPSYLHVLKNIQNSPLYANIRPLSGAKCIIQNTLSSGIRESRNGLLKFSSVSESEVHSCSTSWSQLCKRNYHGNKNFCQCTIISAPRIISHRNLRIIPSSLKSESLLKLVYSETNGVHYRTIYNCYRATT